MYGAHEAKLYYVEEEAYGITPPTPPMKGMNENLESVEPAVDPGLIKIRGFGSRDLTDIQAGLRKVNLKVAYYLPKEDVLNFLKHVETLVPQTVEVWYEKNESIVDLRHIGCLMDRATVSCSVEDAVKASIDLIALDLMPENSKIPDATYTDYGGLIPFNACYVKRGEADGSNLTTLEEITDWKCTIENNLKRVPVIRSNPQSLLTANANSGQKVVAVAAGSLFKAKNQVKIMDDITSEDNIIDSIDGDNLTMMNNLANTYTVAANAKVTALVSNLLKYLRERHRNLAGELTFEFENRTEFFDVIHDSEFSLQLGLGDTEDILFKYCKWDNVIAPTRIEDLVSLKAPFTARDVVITTP